MIAEINSYNKREYNSERRRKLCKIFPSTYKIYYKREYNSERRRKLILFSITIYIMNKREYNSERRRKLKVSYLIANVLRYKREYNFERRRKLNNIKELQVFFKTCNIRENITPRGDRNSYPQ